MKPGHGSIEPAGESDTRKEIRAASEKDPPCEPTTYFDSMAPPPLKGTLHRFLRPVLRPPAEHLQAGNMPEVTPSITTNASDQRRDMCVLMQPAASQEDCLDTGVDGPCTS